MNLTKVLTIVLLLGSIALAYYLYKGIDNVIEQRVEIKSKEDQMKERLMLIREAEMVFSGANGSLYCQLGYISGFH